MPKESHQPDLSAMPAGLLTFETHNERLYDPLYSDIYAASTLELDGPALLKDDYRLHVMAPLEIEGQKPRRLEAFLRLTPEEFTDFSNPHIVVPESTPIREEDILSVFAEEPEEDEYEEEDEEPRINYEKLRHEARMKIVSAAVGRLLEPTLLNTILASYGERLDKQRDGAALKATDVEQWVEVRGGGKRSWGFFRPHRDGRGGWSNGMNWYVAENHSLVTDEKVDSTQPQFREVLTHDLGLIATAINDVIHSLDAAYEEKGYLLGPYGPETMIGLFSTRDYLSGYTDRDAPAGQNLVSTSFHEAYYGDLNNDGRTGKVSIQTVYKENTGSQPLIERIDVPFGGAEDYSAVYTADTSGHPVGSGLRAHTYKGMYSSPRKVSGFTPERFYATVKYMHTLGNTALAKERNKG